MKAVGTLLLASVGAVLAWGAVFWLSTPLLLLVDSNYHDGFVGVAGFVIGLLAALIVFRAIWRRRSIKD